MNFKSAMGGINELKTEMARLRNDIKELKAK